MRVEFKSIEEMPNYIAWIECNREDLDEVYAMFPKDKYEILVAIKPNYDPITCSTQVLYNPPAPTWGVDVWKRED